MLETPKASKPTKSRIISTVLSPALGLWLRSQVEQVEDLQFKIMGGDRQILKGHIPRVSIAASHAIYQGLHLSNIQLEGSDIRVNLGQVIKGKPLRLLEPVPIMGQLLLQKSDLQASLESPLLSNALTEFLEVLLETNGITKLGEDLKQRQISWQQIDIDAEQVTLCGTLIDSFLGTMPVVIRAGLQLVTPQKLQLHPLQIEIPPTLPLRSLDAFQVDLGPEVDIQELTLTSEQLMCRGRLSVLP
ncbi:MAG TPA: DUF2993 domain-containing protein [Coleofasciculaceae cyanobacterium]